MSEELPKKTCDRTALKGSDGFQILEAGHENSLKVEHGWIQVVGFPNGCPRLDFPLRPGAGQPSMRVGLTVRPLPRCGPSHP